MSISSPHQRLSLGNFAMQLWDQVSFLRYFFVQLEFSLREGLHIPLCVLCVCVTLCFVCNCTCVSGYLFWSVCAEVRGQLSQKESFLT